MLELNLISLSESASLLKVRFMSSITIALSNIS